MKHFIVLWSSDGERDLLRARAFLGPREEELNAELERVGLRLSALPLSYPRAKSRKGWSRKMRRVLLDDTPFNVYYLVNVEAETITIVELRHKNRRPRR